MTTSSEKVKEAQRAAVKDSLPIFLPAIPFGFIVGVAIVESVMPAGVGFLTSPLIFAGAAQLALVTLVGSASAAAAITTAVVINARHVMYSAAMAPAFKGQPRWFRWFGPAFLIDQVFALSIPHADDDPAIFRRYYMTCASVFSIGWIFLTSLGMAFGAVIPEAWQLGYAPAVMFAGLVVMGLDRRPAVVSAVVGASVCFVAIGLPNRSGLLVGAICGVAAGMLVRESADEKSESVTA